VRRIESHLNLENSWDGDSWRQRLVGRRAFRTVTLAAYGSSVLDQRDNLHKLDGRAHSVKTRYALQKCLAEKCPGGVL